MKKTIEKIKQALQPDGVSQANEKPSDVAGLEKHLSTLPPEARDSVNRNLPILKEVHAGVLTVRHAEKAIEENAELRASAEEQIKSLSTSVGNAKAIAQEIMDNRLRLELANVKEGPLHMELMEVREQLLDLTKRAVARFEREVWRKKEQLESDLFSAVQTVLGKRANDFFTTGGNLGLNSVRYDFARAHFDQANFLHNPGRSECRELSAARNFINHATRHAEIVGIDLETLYLDDPATHGISDATIERAVRNALKEAGVSVPAAA